MNNNVVRKKYKQNLDLHKPLFLILSKQYTVHSKKCWVKYNPVLRIIWTNSANGLFWPNGWVTAQKVMLNI